MTTALSKLRIRTAPPLMSLSFNAAKVVGKGEDADPLLRVDPSNHVVMIGVFDGLGGSGSMRSNGADGIHTSAYYAARVARDCTDTFLRSAAPFADVTPDALAGVLAQHLVRDLQAHDAEWGRASASRLRSTLFRRLPTTAAIAVVRPSRKGTRATVLWAGDSRCFVLSPTCGLQQLTVDHLRTPGDALANLTNDSSISNCITADEPFFVDGCELLLPTPCIVLAATDGCFGYVATPMHFESLLLASLLDGGSSAKQWGTALRARTTAVAADDASLALVAVGWRTHRALRHAFADRFRLLRETYIDPLDQAPADAPLRVQLWDTYRKTYEALQPKEVACAAK
jgi:hypothetical protein